MWLKTVNALPADAVQGHPIPSMTQALKVPEMCDKEGMQEGERERAAQSLNQTHRL